jgi:hypothetical protein
MKIRDPQKEERGFLPTDFLTVIEFFQTKYKIIKNLISYDIFLLKKNNIN